MGSASVGVGASILLLAWGGLVVDFQDCREADVDGRSEESECRRDRGGPVGCFGCGGGGCAEAAPSKRMRSASVGGCGGGGGGGKDGAGGKEKVVGSDEVEVPAMLALREDDEVGRGENHGCWAREDVRERRGSEGERREKEEEEEEGEGEEGAEGKGGNERDGASEGRGGNEGDGAGEGSLFENKPYRSKLRRRAVPDERADEEPLDTEPRYRWKSALLSSMLRLGSSALPGRVARSNSRSCAALRCFFWDSRCSSVCACGL